MTTPIGPLPPVSPFGEIGPAAPAAPSAEGGASGTKSFGDLLGDKLEALGQMQTDATNQAQALATGTATDVSEVVMSVERASLGLQVAAQVRNKAVEAYQEILRMQV